MVLERALAKAFKGFHNLYGKSLKSVLYNLTGAPTISYSVINIPSSQVVTPNEQQHIDEFWAKLAKNLSKGFIAYLVPREPTEEEIENNQESDRYMKQYHLNNGIYFHHSYPVLALKELRYQGKSIRLVKLRNAWINEIWGGDWSNSSELWNDDLRAAVGYEEGKIEHGCFWMSVRDTMAYFEEFNVNKVMPRYFYSNLKVVPDERRFGRAVILAKVVKKGKYTFTVNQQDTCFFPSSQFVHSPIKLTLGMFGKDSKPKILAHTST